MQMTKSHQHLHQCRLELRNHSRRRHCYHSRVYAAKTSVVCRQCLLQENILSMKILTKLRTNLL